MCDFFICPIKSKNANIHFLVIFITVFNDFHMIEDKNIHNIQNKNETYCFFLLIAILYTMIGFFINDMFYPIKTHFIQQA